MIPEFHKPILAGAALMALAACQAAVRDAPGLERDETLLTVTATGSSDAAPDVATIEAGVNSLGASASAASAANAEKMRRISQILERSGVKEGEIQTRDLSVQRIDWGANKGKYEVRNIVRIRTRKTDDVGPLVGALTDAGANIVNGPSLTSDDPEKAALGAHGSAYKAALAKANAYADAAGMTVSRVLAITEGYQPKPSPYRNIMIEQASAPPPVVAPQAPPVYAGTNRSTAMVTVDFALAKK